MKPFKFRVWCFETKNWVEEECSINKNGELFLHTAFESHNITNDKRFYLCFSTGLLDKNGKEIFEGDILNLGNNNNYYYVEWKTDRFWLSTDRCVIDDSENLGTYRICLPAYCKDSEMIGNQFENPELLDNLK